MLKHCDHFTVRIILCQRPGEQIRITNKFSVVIEMKIMFSMTSLLEVLVADYSTFLRLQRGMLDHKRCTVESVVQQVSRLMMNKDVIVYEDW